MNSSKSSTFSSRFREALEIRNFRQSTISELTHINKGTINNYLSGKYAPKDDKLKVIAAALDVSEAWLRGYDVPMNPESIEDYIDNKWKAMQKRSSLRDVAQELFQISLQEYSNVKIEVINEFDDSEPVQACDPSELILGVFADDSLQYCISKVDLESTMDKVLDYFKFSVNNFKQ